MAHHRPDDIWVNALQGQPRSGRVSETVKIQDFALVVLDRQKVAFLSFGAGFGMVLEFVQPSLAGLGGLFRSRQSKSIS